MGKSQPGGKDPSTRERPSAFQGVASVSRVTARNGTLTIVRKSAAPDATTLLRADHKVTELFERFDKMKGDGAQGADR